ncbi:TetR family transcriptional regulator [Psychroflexus sp. S27]|uniref:TetR/AcrR family transcriptional regulator n=1 Tax=Psychroflexus sp. S27 TaxID=1982757 RepID=UPI000C2A5059|nr:TetR/AcrR family transcriptional regulator [Psychroflexus sp. S27]PJX24477.1 TetR family transcriptional regulator [Psychroflexus sp. S27]
MNQQEKVTDKKKALLDATLNLVNNDGFHKASMSKIAKLAKVAPATIYLYFENKQDLINSLYLTVKSSFSEYAFKDYRDDLPVKKGFEIIWYNIADYKLNKIDEATFLSQCDNTPIIDATAAEEGLKHLQPLLDLWEKAKEEGIVKPLSNYILYAYTIYPLSFLLAIQQKSYYSLNDEMRQKAFQSAWDAIKI